MKKLYNLKTVEKDNHTMFTYGDGHKTPIPDDGVVFCYLAPETENGRMLKVTEWPDRAGAIDGKFVCTDEITNDHGTPCVDGEGYNIWGIGSDEIGDYVITSARGDKFYINAKQGAKVVVTHPNQGAKVVVTHPNQGAKVVVTHPNQGDKKNAYIELYDIYSMLI